MAGILATSLGWPSRGGVEGNDGRDTDVEVNTQPNSVLMDQPVDIVFSILEHLPPESAVAFTLTCKLAFSAFFPKMKERLDITAESNLLMLLEEDLSHRLFFCHNCQKLHRLDPSWTRDPGPDSDNTPILSPSGGRIQLPCRPLIYSPWHIGIGFHHVKLATNAHLWGFGYGMSLTWLNKEMSDFKDIEDARLDGWRTSHDARMSGDGQLFLRVKHKALLVDRHQRLRAIGIFGSTHSICLHMAYWDEEFKWRRELNTNQMVDRSCRMCLTDYTVSFKRGEYHTFSCSAVAGMVLEATIVSYHQLGLGRSPSDPAWFAFSTPPALSNCPDYAFTISTVINHEPGTIKRQWDALG